MALVVSLIPEPTLQDRQRALTAATRYALSKGITTVVDMGRAPFADAEASWRDLEELYDTAADAGELPIRCERCLPAPAVTFAAYTHAYCLSLTLCLAIKCSMACSLSHIHLAQLFCEVHNGLHVLQDCVLCSLIHLEPACCSCSSEGPSAPQRPFVLGWC